MQIFRYCEQGSIKLLWISATNPAVSMPQLDRIRHILAKKDLFVIVQDAFMTETTQFADVVLPTGIWGEKPAATPMPDARCISHTRRSTRRARPAPIWIFSLIMPGAWIFATEMARR